MNKEEVRAEIVKGEWSESFLNMLLRLADSLGEPVSVKELSTILHPLRFLTTTLNSVNKIFEARRVPIRLEFVDEDPKILWFDLEVRMILLT